MKITFNDNQAEALRPITLTRSASAILCGGTTLSDLAQGAKALGGILQLSASLAPSVKMFNRLTAQIKLGQSFKIKRGGKVVGAYLVTAKGAPDKIKTFNLAWPRFEKLSDVISLNRLLLKENLDYFKSGYRQYRPGVFVGKNVRIAKEAAFDTSAGVIVIADQANILPFVYIAGPVYIGRETKINEFASIKSGTSIGAVCKVGGEVEASIMQGYDNKQHHGVLAHSYLGEWVNLGGGTTTSNLKNTYSQVKMQGQDSGGQFLGAVFGDYSKTAINVGIYTGKVIGVNSFIYDTVAQDVPSFTNHLGRLGPSVAVDLAVALRVQKAMMVRRNVRQTKAHIKLLEDVFKLTQGERDKAGIKKGKLAFL